ncbi:MAG: dihydrofolate reductase [Steroidobacteraceae bacterium]
MALASLELVVAAAENDVIGRANRLPWRLSADLRRFKALTIGRHVLMGRKTFESIGRALPDRVNLVLSRSMRFRPPDCIAVASLAEARDAAPLVMVIGGAEVYRQCLPMASRIHLTRVHTHIADGDTFFDGYRDAPWRETFREDHAADQKNEYPYSFITLERP